MGACSDMARSKERRGVAVLYAYVRPCCTLRALSLSLSQAHTRVLELRT